MKDKISSIPDKTRPVFDGLAISMLAVLSIFFVGQFCVLGEMFHVDTQRIVAFSPLVSPLYPWLISAFRFLFGPNIFHLPLILFQNLFISWCIFSFCEYLSRAFLLHRGFLCLFTGTFIGCFAAQILFTDDHNIVTNGLLTECLALPLYFLLCKYFLDVLLHRKLRSWYIAALLSFLLFNVRGQLAWVMVPLFILGFLCPKNKDRFSSVALWALRPFLTIFVIVILSSAFSSFTNRIHDSNQDVTSLGSLTLLSTAVYCSQPKDLALFSDDPRESVIFEQIDTFVSEKQSVRRYAPSNLYNRFAFFSKNYDRTKNIVFNSVIANAGTNVLSVSLDMSRKLIATESAAFFSHCALNFMVGLVRSATLFKPVFTELTLLAYLGALVIFAAMKRCKDMHRVRPFLGLVLFCIFLNSLFVSIGVFALPRYMFYNMPLLYVCIESILVTLFFSNKKRGVVRP